MRILVTGAGGMVGSVLCPELRRRGHEVIATDLRPLDGTMTGLDVRDANAMSSVIKQISPEIVIHLAAETDVDRCELERDHAYLTNAVGTECVMRGCQEVGARLLYVSTAGVFDGLKEIPYVETDAPNPVNVYGRTKLAGEFAVRQYEGMYQIVRAGWMFGGYERDKKFVGKVLRLLRSESEISVVTDKVGSPTFTEDLARGIAALIETGHVGLFHMTNKGVCSRYDVACKIVQYLGREDVTIRPITSEGFPLPAPRAPSEAMQNLRLQSLGLDMMPYWDEALRSYLRPLLPAAKSSRVFP